MRTSTGGAIEKSRFTQSQIVGVLKQVDARAKAEDVCQEHGISYATYYNWKSKYGGMQASDLRRMKDLGKEKNRPPPQEAFFR